MGLAVYHQGVSDRGATDGSKVGSVPDQFIVGVDIGSSKLCAAVAVRERSGAIRYVGHGSAPSAGLRGGEVVDPAALSAAFTRAVEEARYLVGTPVHDIVVSVSGARVEPLDRTGGIDLSGGRPIDHADVVRAISSSRGGDPTGLHTIHRVVQTLSVDGARVDDPTGRIGNRLDVVTRDYAVPAQLVDRLRRAADSAGVRIHTLIPEGVAAAAAALSEEERDAGVVLIDVGAATSDVAVYVDGDLRHVAGLMLGGHHITVDLVSILEVPIEEAETLKRRHGGVTATAGEEVFEWSPRSVALLQRQAVEGNPDPAAIRSVAAARMVQLFEQVADILDTTQLRGQLRAGVVLTGGGSQLHGINDIAMAVLNLRVRSGVVLAGDGFPEIADPSASAAVGLVRYCALRSGTPVPAPVPARPESRSSGATAIVHPLVMKTFTRSDRPRRGGHNNDTIAHIPARRLQGQRPDGWGAIVRQWMSEFNPGRNDQQ